MRLRNKGYILNLEPESFELIRESLTAYDSLLHKSVDFHNYEVIGKKATKRKIIRLHRMIAKFDTAVQTEDTQHEQD